MNELVDLGSSRRRKRANSGRVEWNTPACVLECVERLGPIALDPCWNERSLVRARVTYDEAANGLVQDWKCGGLVFVNSPYGAALKQWVPKIIVEAQLGCEIVALLPNSTEAAWFAQLHAVCDAAVAWRGRMTFLGAPSPAFFGSVLFYFGERRKRFLVAFAGHAYSIKGAR